MLEKFLIKPYASTFCFKYTSSFLCKLIYKHHDIVLVTYNYENIIFTRCNIFKFCNNRGTYLENLLCMILKLYILHGASLKINWSCFVEVLYRFNLYCAILRLIFVDKIFEEKTWGGTYTEDLIGQTALIGSFKIIE